MTPADLERLAEACERAAVALLNDFSECTCITTTCDVCKRDSVLIQMLEDHARAIRAGRVSVKEED